MNGCSTCGNMTYVGGTMMNGSSNCAGCTMSSGGTMAPMQGTPINGSVVDPTPANSAVEPVEAVSPPTPVEVENKEET